MIVYVQYPYCFGYFGAYVASFRIGDQEMNAFILNKEARVEFKTSQKIKDLLMNAATLSGLDLTSFILKNSEEKAREVIAQHQELILNKAAQEKFIDILTNPPKPTEALIDLMRMERLPTR